MIPQDLQLPVRPIDLSDEERDKYITDLTYTLEDSYRDIANGVNGFLKTDFTEKGNQWIPSLIGSFTYTHQTGWAIRKALTIDIWFDIQWTASTSVGNNLQIQMPYKVALTNNLPFVGIVQSSDITYTAGTDIVLNADSNLYTATFYNVGNGITSSPQLVVNSGRVMGHLSYIGQGNDEN